MFERVIVVTGMPRSGTSWLGEIVNSSPNVRLRVSPPFSYEMKNCIDTTSGRADWDRMLTRAYHSNDPFMAQSNRRSSGEYPSWDDKPDAPPVLCIKFDRFLDLVEPMMELYPDVRVCAIVRHPCGAIHSWLTAPREFPPDCDPMAYWRCGTPKKIWPGDFFGFDDWKRMTRLHVDLAERYPDRFALVQYEKLVDRPVAETRRIFDVLNLPFEARSRDFVDQSHQRHVDTVYSVFKSPSVKDRWRSELAAPIRDEILREIEGSPLQAFAPA